MKSIDSNFIEEVCYKLMTHASIELPPQVKSAIENAHQRETHELGKLYLTTMLKNLEIAKKRRTPICQDTGMPIFYINLGSELQIRGSLRDAVNKATARATVDVPLRQQVTHPLSREVATTNVGWGMPNVFFDYIDGNDSIEITAVPRGGGGEAKWQCVIPYPNADREKAILKIVLDTVSMAGGESCTPIIIGVAVGGYGRDYTSLLSRKAIYRTPLNSRHPDSGVARLEEIIFEKVNETGIGPLGIGGDTTCLGVHMEVEGTHTGGWSVGVGMSCWCARYSKAIIKSNNEVEYSTHPNLH